VLAEEDLGGALARRVARRHHQHPSARPRLRRAFAYFASLAPDAAPDREPFNKAYLHINTIIAEIDKAYPDQVARIARHATRRLTRRRAVPYSKSMSSTLHLLTSPPLAALSLLAARA
jgi:hypothetical protein